MASAGEPKKDSQDPSDVTIVEQAKRGDRDAFRVLVERYQGRAFRLALRVLRDEEQARDAVQDAFIKVYGNLEKFQGKSSFYTWFYRLVMNHCLDMKRRDRSGRHVDWDEDRAKEVVDASDKPDASPEADFERSEMREVLADAIESLPEDARRTLQLREIDGLSYVEISKCMGIPKGTVMSRLHYARKRLREILIESGAVDGNGSPMEGGVA